MEGRRLYRAREDRWIGGVCAGLGRFFGVNPMPIRVGFLILSLWNGFGVLVYLVMLLVVPEEPATHVVTDPVVPQEHGEEDPRARRVRILGVILVMGGVYLFLQNLEILTQAGERLIAVSLIVAGIAVLLMRPGRI